MTQVAPVWQHSVPQTCALGQHVPPTQAPLQHCPLVVQGELPFGRHIGVVDVEVVLVDVEVVLVEVEVVGVVVLVVVVCAWQVPPEQLPLQH